MMAVASLHDDQRRRAEGTRRQIGTFAAGVGLIGECLPCPGGSDDLIPQALDVTRREPPKAQDFHGHLAQCDYFTVDAVEGDFEDVCDETSFTSLLVLEGKGTLTETATGESLPIRKGQSLFLPAGTGAYAVTGTDLKCLRTRV